MNDTNTTTKPGVLLTVLNRAAGDATGNPVEGGQAYAAIEEYKALVSERDALAAALVAAEEGLRAAADLIAAQNAKLQGGAA